MSDSLPIWFSPICIWIFELQRKLLKSSLEITMTILLVILLLLNPGYISRYIFSIYDFKFISLYVYLDLFFCRVILCILEKIQHFHPR